jgi:hypothetical protein
MNRALINGVVLLLGAFASLALARTGPETDLSFRVLLDGKPIGQHRFELREDGDSREVLSQAEFKVRFLFLYVYRYQHTATERWRGDCLESLDARTDDNGDIGTVDASRRGDGLTVKTTRSQDVYQGCVRSFAYWNPKILEGGRLLNAQTGEYLPVRVLAMGEDRIPVKGRIEPTRRYRLTGKDIDIDLWYTLDREWVALESNVDDGHLLRYVRN